ncbi:hypothetical protein ABPG77_007905, partial [Micractinium sp. CCAP 211/92]
PLFHLSSPDVAARYWPALAAQRWSAAAAGAAAVMAVVQRDPIAEIRHFVQEKPKQLEASVKAWASKQPAWVEGVVVGLQGSVQGIFLGAVMGYVGKMNVDAAASSECAGCAASVPERPWAPQMLKMGGPLVQARNFAVMTGVNAGVAAFMKRWRGKDDINNQLVSAFFSGSAFSLVSGGISGGAPPVPGAPPPNPLMAAFSAGVVFALFNGAFIKLGEMWGGPKDDGELSEYARVKAMLSSLGLSKYERNVKRGLLTDSTIGLWDADSLRDVRIPPGPRLLILAHIDQYRHILRPAMPIPKQLPHD